jgi:septal ring factor EnvC (AmiA/AmiB activator)
MRILGNGKQEAGYKISRGYLSFSVFFFLSFNFLILPIAYADNIDKLTRQIEMEKRQLNEIEDKINKQKTKVSTVKKEEDSVLSKLNILNRSLKIAEKEFMVYGLELSEIQNRREGIETKEKESESKMNRQKRLLHDRLRALYKEGNLTYLKIALSANNFTDFIQKIKYMERIAEHDSKIVEIFFKEQKDLERYRLTLSKSEEEVRILKEEVSKKREKMKMEKKGKERLLSEIKEKRVVYERIKEELEDSSRQLMGLIEMLEKKRKEASTVLPPKGAGDFALKRGSLPWPITGNTIANFGKVREPKFNTYIFNNGIEIGSSPGIDVKTIYAGDIIFADWFRGYGKLIIIDHGEGYYSLYGHLDEIEIGIGERVKAGDIIGKVGDTDSINGYTLYFEIRQRGKPEDPLVWLMPYKTAHK